MCLISSSEIQKRITLKSMLQGMDFFCHLQTSPPFARPFRRPLTPVFRRTGTSPSVRVSLSPALFFDPSRTGNTQNFPLYVHQTPSLSRRSRHTARTGLSPALSFIRPGRQTQTSPMHKQHFLYSFVPSPVNGQLRFCRQHRISLAKALSFSPSLLLPPLLPPPSSLLLPAAAFRSLFTSFYHKHLPAEAIRN